MSEMRDGMTLMDLLRLLKRFKKPVAAVPITCALVTVAVTATACLLGFDLDPIKYAVVVLLASLFVLIAAIVAWDSWKMPVKSVDDLEGATGIRVLGEVPSADGGERLFANLRFAVDGDGALGCGDAPLKVALVPVCDQVDASLVSSVLDVAACMASWDVEITDAGPHDELECIDEADDDSENAVSELPTLHIVRCAPIDAGMGAVWAARDAGATVVVVREWQTSLREVEETLRALSMAGVAPVGFALLPEDESMEGGQAA